MIRKIVVLRIQFLKENYDTTQSILGVNVEIQPFSQVDEQLHFLLSLHNWQAMIGKMLRDLWHRQLDSHICLDIHLHSPRLRQSLVRRPPTRSIGWLESAHGGLHLASMIWGYESHPYQLILLVHCHIPVQFDLAKGRRWPLGWPVRRSPLGTLGLCLCFSKIFKWFFCAFHQAGGWQDNPTKNNPICSKLEPLHYHGHKFQFLTL